MDVICFSHLRWNFVYQRPQHLMSRFATEGRVFFIEEVVGTSEQPHFDVTETASNVFVCVPRVSDDIDVPAHEDIVVGLLHNLLEQYQVKEYVTWFYTPMMFRLSHGLRPYAIVYDCMDQLSAFKNSPPEMVKREEELFKEADLVFTGGRSLYEAKRHQHPAVFEFPSSIDKGHFAKAMHISGDSNDQAAILHPRIGFVGVIDERADLELLASVADMLTEYNFVMVGPVVKIDVANLPQRSNIHYLGQKNYEELPSILAGWDVAMMPFALNESTRYISPTKTPEFLTAGLPVVSTAVADVVDPYGKAGLVSIARTPEEFVSAIEAALACDRELHRKKSEEFLRDLSWDATFMSMKDLIHECINKKSNATAIGS